MENKGWQDWVQWVGSCILIPLVGVVSYKVFNNSERLAVMESKQELVKEMRDDIKDIYHHVLSLEGVDDK